MIHRIRGGTLYLDGQPVGHARGVRVEEDHEAAAGFTFDDREHGTFTCEATFTPGPAWPEFFRDVHLADLRHHLADALTRYRRPDIGPKRKARARRRLRKIARWLARAEREAR